MTTKKQREAVYLYLNPLLLAVWFLVWGICPWGEAPSTAQAAEKHASHASHAHSGSSETHHASKGAEHSCSGAISYSDPDSNHLLRAAGAAGPAEPTVALPDSRLRSGRASYFFELTALPRLLGAYYQLYSVYRI